MLNFKDLDYSIIEIETIGEVSKTIIFNKFEDWDKKNINNEVVEGNNSDSFLWIKITNDNMERLLIGDSILCNGVECKLKDDDITREQIQLEGVVSGWYSINIYDCYFKLLVRKGHYHEEF